MKKSECPNGSAKNQVLLDRHNPARTHAFHLDGNALKYAQRSDGGERVSELVAEDVQEFDVAVDRNGDLFVAFTTRDPSTGKCRVQYATRGGGQTQPKA